MPASDAQILAAQADYARQIAIVNALQSQINNAQAQRDTLVATIQALKIQLQAAKDSAATLRQAAKDIMNAP